MKLFPSIASLLNESEDNLVAQIQKAIKGTRLGYYRHGEVYHKDYTDIDRPFSLVALDGKVRPQEAGMSRLSDLQRGTYDGDEEAYKAADKVFELAKDTAAFIKNVKKIEKLMQTVNHQLKARV